MNETLADILADMRRDAADDDYTEDCILGQSLNEYADRIEAASARELSRAAEDAASKATLDRTAKDAAEYMAYAMAHNSATQGNAAAMREALEGVGEGLWGLMGSSSESAQSNIACDMSRKIRAALSAPARNCDRYGDEDDAFAAWHDALNDGDVVSVRNAFRWLFAKAEGGDHA